MFWFQNRSTKAKFELIISEGKNVNPMLEVKFEQLPGDSIQRLRLAEHKIPARRAVRGENPSEKGDTPKLRDQRPPPRPGR